MTWFKVDDKLHDHRKARAAGSAAMGLWVLAGSWSADNLTDGFVPESVCQRWDRAYRKLAAALVRVDLWAVTEKDGEKGWQFHQWHERQPTRDDIEKKRAEARERMKNQRKNTPPSSPDVRANTDGTDSEVPDRFTEVLVPVPSRPVPNPKDHGQDLGGDRNETLTAPDATKPPPGQRPTTGAVDAPSEARCTKHRAVRDPGPCAGCRAARELAEQRAARAADQAGRAAEAAGRACTRCDGVWVVDPKTSLPTRHKCDHRSQRSA